MTTNTRLEFEILIDDIIENEGVKTGEELSKLSEDLHSAIESAFYDYCMDNDIEDYEPLF